MIPQSIELRLIDETARDQIERLIENTPGWVLETAQTPCDLLILEITKEKVEEEFSLVKDTIESGRTGNVFLVSHLFDPNLLVRALRLGAKEFFTLPLNEKDVQAALLKFQGSNGTNGSLSVQPPETEGTLIHIMGSKGGVGTTTVAVNLASSLAASSGTPLVALVDMNLLFGDVPVFLGIRSSTFDWSEIALNVHRLDRSFLSSTLHKHHSGVQVLPSPASLFKTSTLGPDIVTKLFKLMKTMFDYVIVDGGQALGDMSTALLKMADKVLIVTLLNVPSLVNVKRLRNTFVELGYPSDDRIQIVANRFHRKSAGIPIEEAERTLGKKISWTVPNDFQNTMDAINTGKTLRETAPTSEINKKMMEMADHLRDSPIREIRKSGFFGRVFSR